MNDESKVSRRQLLAGALVAPLLTGLADSPVFAAARQTASNSRALVAYFSRTGNTRVVASQIRRTYDADLFEIRPADPYPDDCEAVVRRATRERDTGFEPSLAATVPNIGSYEVVFLGFPIWATTAPAVVRSFLSHHDLSGKTLVPFITHGGYGRGQSFSVVAQHAPRSRLLEGFVMRADQERETLSQVTRWLTDAEIIR